jgi:lipopolysaccharide export system protein LptA
MYSYFSSLSFKLLALILFLSPLLIGAQNDSAKVNLISADILQYNKSINADYQILTGSVVFEYDGALLYCDIANIYIKKDLVVAKGNVHIIINDTTHMYGDSLRIDGDKDLAEMMGNVKLIDNDVTLTTDHLYYDLDKDVAYYLSGGEITDPSSYLKSERGFYYQKSKDFFFSDSVYVKNEDTEMFSDTLMYNTKTEVTHFFGKTIIKQPDNTMYCEFGTYDTKRDIGKFSKNVEIYSESQILKGDSIYYEKVNGFSEAFQNVFFQDTTDKIMLNSHYARFYEKDSTFFARDSALIRMVEKSDTLFLHADSLFMAKDTVLHMQKVLYAYYKARIWRHDFQAVSDSIVYLSNDSIMFLYQNPIMWLGSTQLVADTIFITYKNGEMDRLHLRQNAFIITQENTSDFQQIKSMNMEGIFSENELKMLWATDSAETLYYIFDDDMLLIGINKTKSQNVKIHFEESQVDNVVFHGKPSGKLSPEDQMSTSEIVLQGFRWEDKIRPQFPEDVFRDPAVQPEAGERPNTFAAHDSLLHLEDSLLISDSLYVAPIDSSSSVENQRNNSKTDIIESQNTRNNGKTSDTSTKSNTSEERNTKGDLKEKSKKQCFLKRWLSKWRDKRNEKKILSLQFE